MSSLVVEMSQYCIKRSQVSPLCTLGTVSQTNASYRWLIYRFLLFFCTAQRVFRIICLIVSNKVWTLDFVNSSLKSFLFILMWDSDIFNRELLGGFNRKCFSTKPPRNLEWQHYMKKHFKEYSVFIFCLIQQIYWSIYIPLYPTDYQSEVNLITS